MDGRRSSHWKGLCPSSQRIVYFKVINRLLLVVDPTHIELWSSFQHKVRLGKFKRDSDSIQTEGENMQAVWSPDAKLIAILTTSFYLHIYKVQFTEKRIQIGGKQPSGLFLADINLLLNEQVPFSVKDLTVSNIVCDNKHLLIGLSNGSLYIISWKGEFYGAFDINFHLGESNEVIRSPYTCNNGSAPGRVQDVHPSGRILSRVSGVVWLEFSLLLRMLFVLYSDGQLVLCSVSKRGLKQPEYIRADKILGSQDAVCASVASDQQILAVGTKKGIVELYDLAESASLIRTVSLDDWGYSVDDTGPVSCIAWTPDNYAFAVGWKLKGLAVWSVSGCRLMSTFRQVGLSSVSSPVVKQKQDSMYEPLMNGTALIQWDEFGYRLYAVEEHSSERIIVFSFGKCCLNRGVSDTTYIRQVIYGEDRVLLVQSEETDDLRILHLNLPVSYVIQNWPVLHVAASKDGMYLAVAGLHGLILYDIRSKKWRVFGDITQEQKIQCKGLLWLGKIVIVCNYVDSSNTYELLFYPRYHLDESSVLCRKSLLAKPLVMDVYQDYILVTYHPFDVHIFHVKLSGELAPASNPKLQLSTVRELSIMTAKSHPASMRFIPDQIPQDYVSTNDILSSSELSAKEPSRCLILRANGELSLLDLDDGHERELTDSVELFWVTSGQSEEKANLIEEVSWLDYGHRGMQVWYPSPGADPFKQEDFLQLDPELEFDREVYPLGLLPNAGMVVGVCQRMSFSACTEFPCFEPSPQAQTILHCLLRHFLQRDKIEEALRLTRLSAEKPHFSHCLEWLLFTVFEAEISRQNANKIQTSFSDHVSSNSLLKKACDLIRKFPEYHDVVVSVARKTDGRHWADLFSAAGRSTELFEECFLQRWYRTAACYILVIAKLEGPAVSQYCALRLLQATLDDSLYELAGELVRFLLRSGREYEQPSTESDRLSPRFLGYFLFPSKRQPLDSKSISFKEQSPHVAPVKSILESHASYLMSGKELSKLVAFVKGTQFDIVEFLQRERYGSARLENFASGLQLIEQKLQMGTLQSRLDAEFLLAHMCSVKFKEWIVVLATLLRRSEVLVDLFRHDMRLWRAYNDTLQSQPAFVEYHDFLEDLEARLSSS
ncbi:hypothetical protein Nepgr_019109 [Nepenthes gracilis]|uniref:RIC1 C-terminal alpha solenoid region domain-containing protein n=1 Tax=Nepenthes gracilis TaxID=150966 RepID=A0AAD3SSM3_NEPGR|nr:hypothetical protein Nepgr_019109 [Nepenthes gracilis]